ncbi:hypothetical protein LXL04_025580 [Taraxacum kok-saghyz]
MNLYKLVIKNISVQFNIICNSFCLFVFIGVVFVFDKHELKFVSCSCRVRVWPVSCSCLIPQTRIEIRVVFVFAKFVSCKFVSDTNTRHDDTNCQIELMTFLLPNVYKRLDGFLKWLGMEKVLYELINYKKKRKRLKKIPKEQLNHLAVGISLNSRGPPHEQVKYFQLDPTLKTATGKIQTTPIIQPVIGQLLHSSKAFLLPQSFRIENDLVPIVPYGSKNRHRNYFDDLAPVFIYENLISPRKNILSDLEQGDNGVTPQTHMCPKPYSQVTLEK